MFKLGKGELSLFVLPLLVPLLMIVGQKLNASYVDYAEANKPPALTVNAGTFTWVPIGEQTVMRKLSRLLKEKPHIAVFTVQWTIIDSRGKRWPEQLTYNRWKGRINIGTDLSNSFQRTYVNVTDEAIHTVSKEKSVVKALSWRGATARG